MLGAGLVLGLLYRLGAKVLPALFIGLFAAHWLIRGYSVPVSVWLSLSLLSSQWLALVYMRRFFCKKPLQRPVHNFLHFYVAAMLIAPLVNALLDLPLLLIFDLAESTGDVRIFFLSYTLGEALGSLVFAPAIMLYGRNFHLQYAYADYSSFRKEQRIWLAAAGFLILLTLLIGNNYLYAGILDTELLLYPMITWSALRLGVIFTNVAVAVVSLTVFTFHFFGLAGSPGQLYISQTLSMLVLIITVAILGQLVSATTLLRRKREEQLAEAANIDAITGLPNLRSLKQSLYNLSTRTKATNMLGYSAICDYEVLVQGFGLESRNALYSQVSGFLQMEKPAGVELYRVSGPAFALLFIAKDDEQSALVMRSLAERIRHFRFIWQGRPLHVNAVLSLVPAELLSGELQGPIEHASALADRAYQEGNIGKVLISSRDSGKKLRKSRAEWLVRLNGALAEEHFRLFAQPIRPVAENRQVRAPLHFEILLRLEGAGGRMIMPEEFLPQAESFNLLPNIDRWVVGQVLQWLSALQGGGRKVDLCSINLSGQSLTDPEFSADIADLIQSHNVPAAMLCFEIAEASIYASLYNANSLLLQLRDLGCKITLDRFGSGFSSFEYLKKLPLDYLKIDGALIKSMPDSETDFVIVDAVKRVANSIQLDTVAEYVESEEILNLLMELGVTYAQGFHVGVPVPLEQLLSEQDDSRR